MTFSPGEADAAALRRIFDYAVATYPRHLAVFLSKDAEKAFYEWWGNFYAAVRDHEAGLKLLARLAELEAENARLSALILNLKSEDPACTSP